MKLNEKIIACRRRAGLSQEALAEQVGVSRQAVSKWECGDAVPEPGKILLLARTFGVTTDWLLDDTLGEPDPRPDPLDSEPNPEPCPQEGAVPGWIDTLPSVVGRFLRRWGWLAGVYLMLIGLFFIGIGGAARVAFGSIFSASTVPLTGPEVIIRDGTGDIVDDLPGDLTAEIYDALDLPGYSSSHSAASFGMIVPNFIITIGVVILLVGAVTAILLWRTGRGGKNA